MTCGVRNSSRLNIAFIILLGSLLLSGCCPPPPGCPGALADYKIIHASTNTLVNLGDTLVIEFELPPGARFINGPEQPFFTYNISMLMSPPQEIEITLNGTTLDTPNYTSNSFVSTKTLLAPGTIFLSGQNSLEFSLVSGSGIGQLGIEISDVIVHFQQDICAFLQEGDPGTKNPGDGQKD